MHTGIWLSNFITRCVYLFMSMQTILKHLICLQNYAYRNLSDQTNIWLKIQTDSVATDTGETEGTEEEDDVEEDEDDSDTEEGEEDSEVCKSDMAFSWDSEDWVEASWSCSTDTAGVAGAAATRATGAAKKLCWMM